WPAGTGVLLLQRQAHTRATRRARRAVRRLGQRPLAESSLSVGTRGWAAPVGDSRYGIPGPPHAVPFQLPALAVALLGTRDVGVPAVRACVVPAHGHRAKRSAAPARRTGVRRFPGASVLPG